MRARTGLVAFAVAVAMAIGGTAGVADAGVDQEQPPPSIQIIGGGNATEAYPWMASFQLNGTSHNCGASLIHAQWAITARHCADAITNLGALRLRIGSSTYNAGGTVSAVDRVVTPPGDVVGEDIALLHLPSPVPNTPIRLAPDAGAAGTPTRIIGWGLTCPTRGCGAAPVNLQQLDTTLSADGSCALGGIVGATEICVGQWFANTGACFGDSGGPALRRVGSEWQLTGVTSRLAGLVAYCGIAPSIYGDATAFRSFISTTIGTPV
jgi:secreted trypsin-like serine protease